MKKIVAIVLCVVLMSLALVACGAPAAAPAAETAAAADAKTESAAPAAASKDVKLALVLHAMNSSFFAKIQEGAQKAGEDLGITVDVMAPSVPNSLDEQVNMIETCISKGYDGIATVVWDPEGFNSVIKKAKDAGITVVGINQDAPDSGRQAFIGQDNEDAGYQLGMYMFGDVMGGKGNYIVASCAPTNTALIARTEGIRRAAKEFPEIKELTLVDIGTDLTGAVSVIENAYAANPDVTAFLGVDVYSEAIGTFVASKGLEGKVYGAGFDLTEGTLKHIKNNAMQLTIGQNPFLQGYYPMVEMFLNKTYGYAPIDFATGAMMVTKDNVDSVQPE